MIAFAAEGAHVTAAKTMLAKIESVILFPLMTLMMALAFFYFLWGAYQFVLNADNDTMRAEGKSHMMYGIIGLLVMISAMAILSIAAGTFGVTVGS
jgi:hypothetical protein